MVWVIDVKSGIGKKKLTKLVTKLKTGKNMQKKMEKLGKIGNWAKIEKKSKCKILLQIGSFFGNQNRKLGFLKILITKVWIMFSMRAPKSFNQKTT